MPRKPKPKTQAQLDAATNQRLLKSYGRGLDWYNEQFKIQLGGCKVCGDGPKTRRLHVDHDHRWVDVKVASKKVNGVWVAQAEYNNEWFFSQSFFKKSEAVNAVKLELKKNSVRALLCHRCNRAMILFKDRPGILLKAAYYLENFAAGKSNKILEDK